METTHDQEQQQASALADSIPTTPCGRMAQHYATRGWAVLPLHGLTGTAESLMCTCVAGAACTTPGAHMLDGFELQDATSDSETIAEWFADYPSANVGIVTGGPRDLAVIRYDRARLPAAARAVLDDLLSGAPGIAQFPDSSSAEAYVAMPATSPATAYEIYPGLSVATAGALIVAPPSRIGASEMDWVAEPPPDLPTVLWSCDELRERVRSGQAVRPVVRRLSDVAAEPMGWLWPLYIPLRAITLLDGDPGRGKSTLLADLTARVTRGDYAPSSDDAMPTGAVLMLSGEDDFASVVRPRLEAARADLAKVFALTEVMSLSDSARQRISLADHVEAIEDACREHGIRLVIVDPVMDFLGGGVDSRSDHAVRNALAPLAAMARELDLAVVLVRHLVKRQSGGALNHGSGSIAFGGLARSALRVQLTDDGPELVSVKSPGLRPPSLRFDIIDSVGASGCPIGNVEWKGASTPSTAPDDSAAARAEAFLRRHLEAGQVSATELQKEAKAQDIGWRKVEEAKSAIGVTSRRHGKTWVWSLPAQGRKDAAPLEQDGLAVFEDGDSEEGCQP